MATNDDDKAASGTSMPLRQDSSPPDGVQESVPEQAEIDKGLEAAPSPQQTQTPDAHKSAGYKPPVEGLPINLILAGIVLIAIIAIALFYLPSYLTVNKLSAILPLNKPVSIVKVANALTAFGANATNTKANITYQGTIGVEFASGATKTDEALPFAITVLKNQSVTRENVTFLLNESALGVEEIGSLEQYTVMFISNGTQNAYICSPLLSGDEDAALYGGTSSNYSCESKGEIGVEENASLNKLNINFSDLFSNVTVTLKNVTSTSYKGNSCQLMRGIISGPINIPTSLLNETDELELYDELNLSAIIVSGTFSTCVSTTSYLPLLFNTSTKISLGQTSVKLDYNMNETTISNNIPSQANLSQLPGPLLSLAQVLKGTCYAESINNPLGVDNFTYYKFAECNSTLMNTSGMLKFSYEQTSGENADILGLACTSYTDEGYILEQPTIPPESLFSIVNVTMPSYLNTTLYVKCPLNTTSVGGSFQGDIWAYYSLNGAVNASEIAEISSYATTQNAIGSIQNSGAVHAIPPISQVNDSLAIDQVLNSTPPAIVRDSEANSTYGLIVIGDSQDNTVAAQIFADNPALESTFGPGSIVAQSFGTNRILIAGYDSNGTEVAAREFIEALQFQKSSTSEAVNFGDIPITNTDGEPVVQIVVGWRATQGDLEAAKAIAGAIRNISSSSSTSSTSSSGYTTSTAAPTTTIAGPSSEAQISVTAKDSSDITSRDWELFVDKSPGSYGGAGGYTNASTASGSYASGQSLNTYANLNGTHTIYFVVTQSGGSQYGTYSATVSIYNPDTDSPNAATVGGIDSKHALKIVEKNYVILNSTLVSV